MMSRIYSTGTNPREQNFIDMYNVTARSGTYLREILQVMKEARSDLVEMKKEMKKVNKDLKEIRNDLKEAKNVQNEMRKAHDATRGIDVQKQMKNLRIKETQAN